MHRAIPVELSKALDKAYENFSLADVLDAPVAALASVIDSDAEHLAAAFNIKIVRDLGSKSTSQWLGFGRSEPARGLGRAVTAASPTQLADAGSAGLAVVA